MKNKKAMTQVKQFIYEVENSNFKYKCELLLFIQLILETGIRVSQIPFAELIRDCEIEVLSTKRNCEKDYRSLSASSTIILQVQTRY